MRNAALAFTAAFFFVPAAAHADESEAEYDQECVQKARTKKQLQECIKDDVVSVRAKPPPRSASDWEVDAETIRAAPHDSGAGVLDVVPGLFVGDRGVPGRAPHLSLRGFDGTSGQDVQIFAGNIPLNQISHIRAPGYADMRLIMPEVVKAVRVENGPYDPRQGDFAIAGSMHMDLGLERPGFWAKSGIGSFGGKRIFLAAAPEGNNFADTFVAFESDSTDGPGGNRGGERSSFVGQFGGGEHDVQFHATLAIGSARFDFPGYLPQSQVERGLYPYSANGPLGRDRTSQTMIGADVIWRMGEGTLGLGAFAGKTKTSFHQNLLGTATDPDGSVVSADAEQVNDASMVGVTMLYRHNVELVNKRDSIEAGVYARADSIDQTDTRLNPDLTKHAGLVDATITSTNVAAYADASIYPIKRLVVRGGTRLDSLSYAITDRTNNAGLERTAQGFHLGNKAVADYAIGDGAHIVASYGEGFRSPQARELAEGERVPFATVRGAEAGVRWKPWPSFQTSLVGFTSWLSHDRVFDASLRENLTAPPSTRAGGALALTAKAGAFGTSVSATYTRAWFTESDDRFKDGDLVPYAPQFVIRNDAYWSRSVGKIGNRNVMARLGIGFEGIANRPLPGGRDGKNFVYLDALAAVGWKSLELGFNATNLLGLKYYDSQYVYSTNLGPPQPNVLVSPPQAFFVTLQVHLRGTPEYPKNTGPARDRCLGAAKTTAEEEDCLR